MNRFLLGAMAVALAAGPASAQSLDDLNLQVHGYATQGFLYTTQNNIFYADSSDGSPAWTEAVLNVGLHPSDKLRIGVQARFQLLGTSGDALTIDWAAADYKVNDHFGVRFGKVKTPWGLFNETQDIDPSYMWALLPQSVYDVTTRNADLTHYGGVVYGSVTPAGHFGKLDYRIWGGEEVIPKDDGSFADVTSAGNPPQTSFTYVTYGGALHWRTPIEGLMVGLSDGKANRASAALTGGSESFAPWNNVSYFAQYERNKWMLAAEWNRQASPGTLNIAGLPASSLSSDPRSWYGMATYKVTSKFTAGAYDSQFVDRQQPLGPDRYAKDWVVSGRYDFNSFLYVKAEEHFIRGTALSFENANNTTLAPTSKLTAFKVGVSF